MGRMTRTQITLEEDEYLFLKAEAAETGQSLSAVVRELVRTRMVRKPQPVLHIWELAGILSDCQYDPGISMDHDGVLVEILEKEMGLDEEKPL
jgi:hypothetical protein